MALDINLRILNADTVDTDAGSSEISPVFDFSSAASIDSDNKTPFPEGTSFVVAVTTPGPAAAYPVRFDLELSIDGTLFRKASSVTFTNAAAGIKADRFGLLDYVPEAAVITGTDRAAAVDLKARVVANYTTAAGADIVYDAYIAGPQSFASFNE
jgi:hypothetical protein